jgi:mersacidin/lichenicidin family type 2 lantibiotic
MSEVNVLRAWRDARYRRSLSAEQRAALPENPAGLVELSDEQLKSASGAAGGTTIGTTAPTCTAYSFQNWKSCGCGILTTSITCTEYTFHGWAACCP